MYAGINAWTFPDDRQPEEQLAAASAAGFGGIELVLSAAGPLNPQTPVGRFADLARQATAARLRITSLATSLFWQFNYASPDAVDRQRAADLTQRMLERAAAAQAASILVVPAVVGRMDEPRARVTYADALARVGEALRTLRHEAEALGVTLALENVWNRFLLSPVELADLLDHVNSPSVSAYLDVGNVLAWGYPEDWIATLGGRIAGVHVKDYDLSRPGRDGFCALGEGHVDWPGVVAALRAVGYDGPLTYEGPGDPKEIARRLGRILAGGRPIQEPDA